MPARRAQSVQGTCIPQPAIANAIAPRLLFLLLRPSHALPTNTPFPSSPSTNTRFSPDDLSSPRDARGPPADWPRPRHRSRAQPIARRSNDPALARKTLGGSAPRGDAGRVVSKFLSNDPSESFSRRFERTAERVARRYRPRPVSSRPPRATDRAHPPEHRPSASAVCLATLVAPLLVPSSAALSCRTRPRSPRGALAVSSAPPRHPDDRHPPPTCTLARGVIDRRLAPAPLRAAQTSSRPCTCRSSSRTRARRPNPPPRRRRHPSPRRVPAIGFLRKECGGGSATEGRGRDGGLHVPLTCTRIAGAGLPPRACSSSALSGITERTRVSRGGGGG